MCFKNDLTATQAADICGVNRNIANRYYGFLRRGKSASMSSTSPTSGRGAGRLSARVFEQCACDFVIQKYFRCFLGAISRFSGGRIRLIMKVCKSERRLKLHPFGSNDFIIQSKTICNDYHYKHKQHACEKHTYL